MRARVTLTEVTFQHGDPKSVYLRRQEEVELTGRFDERGGVELTGFGWVSTRVLEPLDDDAAEVVAAARSAASLAGAS